LRALDGHASVALAAAVHELLAEVVGDLDLPALRRLAERDDPVRPGDRLHAVPLQQTRDPFGCVRRRLEQLNSHRASDVESAPHEARLLQHPDQHARILVLVELAARRDVVGTDHRGTVDGGVAQEPVHQPERRRGGDIAARKPPDLGCVAFPGQEDAVAPVAVAACPPDHLHVVLERLGVVVEQDEPDVWFVDPHAERRGRDDHPRVSVDERLLRLRSQPGREPRVIGQRVHPVALEEPCDLLALLSRARVDDHGPVDGGDALQQAPSPLLLTVCDVHGMPQVRSHDAGPHRFEGAPERSSDLLLRLRGRGRGQPEHRRLSEFVEGCPDEQVVRAEVVPPHRHAVHLVHHDEPDSGIA
jgi:hypothetical protein